MDEPIAGQHPRTLPADAGQPRGVSTTRWLSRGGLIVTVAAALAWGAYAGDEASQPEAFAFLAAPIAIGLSMLVALGLLVAGVIARLLHRPALRRWLNWAAGLAIGGTILGVVAGPAVGYRYQPPLYLAGSVDLALEALGADFVPRAGASADCATRENSSAIAFVSAIDLGTLRGVRVFGNLDLGSAGAELWIQMDFGESQEPPGLAHLPNWLGTVTITAHSEGWRTGTASFTDLPTGVDPEVSPAPTGWPVTLSGTLSWTCGEEAP